MAVARVSVKAVYLRATPTARSVGGGHDKPGSFGTLVGGWGGGGVACSPPTTGGGGGQCTCVAVKGQLSGQPRFLDKSSPVCIFFKAWSN